LIESNVCRACGQGAGSVEHHIETCIQAEQIRNNVRGKIGNFSLQEMSSANLVVWLPELAKLVPHFKRI